MPVKIRKKGKGKFSVETPGGTKSKSTSLRKAMAQRRLLRAIKHGFDPKKAKRLRLKY